MLKSVALSCAFLIGIGFSVPSFAILLEEGSEFFDQKGEGESELEVAAGHLWLITKPSGLNATETKQKGLDNLSINFEHGVSKQFSLSAALGYSSQKVDGSPSVRSSGLEDLQLGLKGKTSISGGLLRYGLDATIALAKKKFKANGDENRASGGWALAPYVGYETFVGSGVTGVKLQYELYKSDQKAHSELDGSEATFTGGNQLELAAFYEHAFSDFLLGGFAAYRHIDKTELKDGGLSSDAMKFVDLGIYSLIPVAEDTAVVPSLTYTMEADDAQGDYTQYVLAIAAQFSF